MERRGEDYERWRAFAACGGGGGGNGGGVRSWLWVSFRKKEFEEDVGFFHFSWQGFA